MPTLPSVLSRTHQAPRWLALLAVLLGLGLCLHGPIGQWAEYHAFADQRAWLGLPNAANVLSNLPFLGVGMLAFWHLRVSHLPTASAWRIFSASLVCTAAGSAIYHWAPSNSTLVGDRLPIAWACAALLCAFLAERVDLRWCAPRVLVGALLTGTGSVAFWWLTERAGGGDLRPYLYLQFLPMLLVPAGLMLPALRTFAAATPAPAWWTLLGLYAAAKLMETADGTIFEAFGLLSGHTLKHLLAASGAACLLLAVIRTRETALSSDSRR